MATHLDFQEQEQVEALKSAWQQYGNLVTWTLLLVLVGFAGWNGWNWWQGKQALQAAGMFEALDAAAQSGDADKAARVFADLKDRYSRTTFAEQGGLLAARVQYDKGQADAALASLKWVADAAADGVYRALAHYRIAGILLDKKRYDDALKQLNSVDAPEFKALADDRRGDALMGLGRKDEARTAYQAAWKAMDASLDYRRIVEAKLTAMGAPPAVSAVTGEVQ
jgi:predicted negative regulator of RcsB-dependent stress response